MQKPDQIYQWVFRNNAILQRLSFDSECWNLFYVLTEVRRFATYGDLPFTDSAYRVQTGATVEAVPYYVYGDATAPKRDF